MASVRIPPTLATVVYAIFAFYWLLGISLFVVRRNTHPINGRNPGMMIVHNLIGLSIFTATAVALIDPRENCATFLVTVQSTLLGWVCSSYMRRTSLLFRLEIQKNLHEIAEKTTLELSWYTRHRHWLHPLRLYSTAFCVWIVSIIPCLAIALSNKRLQLNTCDQLGLFHDKLVLANVLYTVAWMVGTAVAGLWMNKKLANHPADNFGIAVELRIFSANVLLMLLEIVISTAIVPTVSGMMAPPFFHQAIIHPTLVAWMSVVSSFQTSWAILALDLKEIPFEDLIETPEGYAAFEKFLRKEFATENLYFYTEANKYLTDVLKFENTGEEVQLLTFSDKDSKGSHQERTVGGKAGELYEDDEKDNKEAKENGGEKLALKPAAERLLSPPATDKDKDKEISSSSSSSSSSASSSAAPSSGSSSSSNAFGGGSSGNSSNDSHSDKELLPSSSGGSADQQFRGKSTSPPDSPELGRDSPESPKPVVESVPALTLQLDPAVAPWEEPGSSSPRKGPSAALAAPWERQTTLDKEPSSPVSPWDEPPDPTRTLTVPGSAKHADSNNNNSGKEKSLNTSPSKGGAKRFLFPKRKVSQTASSRGAHLEFKPLVDRAKALYEKFIGDNAPFQVNISSDNFEITHQNYERLVQLADDDPTPEMFELLQRLFANALADVLKLMKQDSYARFLLSKEFKTLDKGKWKLKTHIITKSNTRARNRTHTNNASSKVNSKSRKNSTGSQAATQHQSMRKQRKPTADSIEMDANPHHQGETRHGRGKSEPAMAATQAFHTRAMSAS